MLYQNKKKSTSKLDKKSFPFLKGTRIRMLEHLKVLILHHHSHVSLPFFCIYTLYATIKLFLSVISLIKQNDSQLGGFIGIVYNFSSPPKILIYHTGLGCLLPFHYIKEKNTQNNSTRNYSNFDQNYILLFKYTV